MDEELERGWRLRAMHADVCICIASYGEVWGHIRPSIGIVYVHTHYIHLHTVKQTFYALLRRYPPHVRREAVVTRPLTAALASPSTAAPTSPAIPSLAMSRLEKGITEVLSVGDTVLSTCALTT